jgi:hypothetical protein
MEEKLRPIYQKLIDAYAAQMKANPTVWTYRVALASNASRLGQIHQRAGRPADAVASYRLAITMMKELRSPSEHNLYSLACYQALLAGVAAEAGSGMTAEQARAAADRAMKALSAAIAAGYRNVAHMRKDTDLDALRPRADFKKLLADLEAKQKDKGP